MPAQKLNSNEKQIIYGIVTDAELGQFGKLEGKIFTKNKARMKIDDLDEIFGATLAMMKLATASETQ